MPGPAPKHPSRRARSNSSSQVTTLPSAGRDGDVPAWPLGVDVSLSAQATVAEREVAMLEDAIADEDDGRRRRTLVKQHSAALVSLETARAMIEACGAAELALWAEVWGTPQAVEWERARAHRAVAQFVRWQVRGENGDLKAAQEARQWSDRLGMNPLALQKLRQEVERTSDVEEKGQRRRSSAEQRSVSKPAAGGDPRSRLRAV